MDIAISQIAPKMGKSPQEMKAAIDKAKKITAGMTNSVEGARQVLAEQGIPTSFIDNMFNKVMPFAKLVGVDPNEVKSNIDTLKNGATDNQDSNTSSRNNPKYSTFDKKKYPRI